MDYYELLGINKSASADEIKKAYKRAAMKNHPDRGGDAEQFAKIQSAYETLSDPQRKQMYDQYGTDDPQQMGGMGGNPFGGGPFGGGFNDMFSHMFGQGFANQQRKNRDIQIVTDITLEDVLLGKKVDLNYRTGSGRTESVSVDIPIGVEPGQSVRYRGLGDDRDPNVPRGDLLVKIRVKRHHVWERMGDDVYSEIPVHALDLILGTEVKVKMLDGKSISLKIPAGTKANGKFSIPGHGMRNRRSGGRGKAFVIAKAIIPKIDDKSLLQEIEQIRQKLNTKHIDF